MRSSCSGRAAQTAEILGRPELRQPACWGEQRLNHEILAQRQNDIHTKLYEALASGDTEVACRAVYAHYLEPMERMRSANSAVQAADEAAK